MTYGSRLKQALADSKRTRAELAAHLDMSTQAVGQVINGGRSGNQTFTASNNVRASVFLKVDPHWLATGEGAMRASTGWPGKQFTLEQIHAWPPEVIEKVETYALGVLSGREITSDTVQKHSDNRLTVDKTGALVKQLSDETKQGQRHGSSDPLPASKRSDSSAS